MARIRTVKPEFWTAEQVMECSPMARLLFIGMWNFCDDRGVHPARSKTLKAEVFPADDMTAAEVDALVAELIENGLLSEFEAEGRQWWYVTGWHHQVINRPSKSRYPEPPRSAPQPSAAGCDDEFNDESHVDHSALTEDSRTEGSRKGREGSKPTPPSSVVPTSTGVARENAPPAALPAGSETSDQAPPTRRGLVCRMLRQAGVVDAAPHHLTDDTWQQILAKRSDEEIVEFARAKLADRPGQRTGLKYLAPGLLEDPKPIAPRARGSPSREESRRIAAGTRLSDFREACASEQQQEHDDGRTLEATPAAARQLG